VWVCVCVCVCVCVYVCVCACVCGSATRAHPLAKILKTQILTEFTVQIDYKTHF